MEKKKKKNWKKCCGFWGRELKSNLNNTLNLSEVKEPPKIGYSSVKNLPTQLKKRIFRWQKSSPSVSVIFTEKEHTLFK